MDDDFVNAYAGFNVLVFILKGHIRQSLEDAPLPIAKLTKLKDDLFFALEHGEWPLKAPESHEALIHERFKKILDSILEDLTQYAIYLGAQRLEKNQG